MTAANQKSVQCQAENLNGRKAEVSSINDAHLRTPKKPRETHVTQQPAYGSDLVQVKSLYVSYHAVHATHIFIISRLSWRSHIIWLGEKLSLTFVPAGKGVHMYQLFPTLAADHPSWRSI